MSLAFSNRFPSPAFPRGILLHGLRLLLRLRSTALPLPRSLLVVAPHPDDECLGCGGLITHTLAAGGRVRILFLSDGEAAGGSPSSALGAQRRAEAVHAAAVLGMAETDLHWLGLPDSKLDRLDPAQHSEFRRALLGLLKTQPADTVAVTSSKDASSEHAASARLTAETLQTCPDPPPLLGYLVWTAWSPRCLLRIVLGSTSVRRLVLGNRILELKREALSCHHSQLQPGMLPASACLPPGFARALCAADEYFIGEKPRKSPLAKASTVSQPERK